MKYIPINSKSDSKIKNSYIDNTSEVIFNSYYSSSQDYSYLFDEIQNNRDNFTLDQDKIINEIKKYIILICVNEKITKQLPKISCVKVDDSIMLEWSIGELRIGFSINDDNENHTWFLVKRSNKNIRSSSGYVFDGLEECLKSIEIGLRDYASR